MTRAWFTMLVALLALAAAAGARVVVFHQPGFPTVDSEAPSRATLVAALQGLDPVFLDLDELTAADALDDTVLLVLPYGSAFPADAWMMIRAHLERGGNLLTLGGRPLWVPVFREQATPPRKGKRRPAPRQLAFRQAQAGNAYWRLLATVHATEVPRRDFERFAWDPVFPFETATIRARRVFAINTQFVANYAAPEGSWRGLGFFLDAAGYKIAAPVTRLDFALAPAGREPLGRGRFVMLPFEPEPGYWDSATGRSLVREAARHAALGSALVWLQLPWASVHDGETAQAVLHVRDWRPAPAPEAGTRLARVELLWEGGLESEPMATRRVPLSADHLDVGLTFPEASAAGPYQLRATYERGGQVVEVHETGFWRRDWKALGNGARLSAGPTFLRLNDQPFIPVGVNMWVNDTVWPYFPENANALEWDRDFAEMEARGLNFVRTGIWHDRLRLIDSATGTAKEEVLRNLEAMFQAAGRYALQVQFTFFVFEPQTTMRAGGSVLGPGRNPYTDPVAVEAQAAFVRSIVARFKDVPYVSWDLINEPSFSNPRAIFRGNQPNADPTEVAAWNEWLRQRYGTTRALAEVWGALPAELRALAITAGMPPSEDPEIAGVPLPEPVDLVLTRNGNPRQVRAFDYNLFAQEMFNQWAAEMVRVIRATGSRQLVAVGQDEGGVSNRLLNHFYGASGIDLTSLHNWWYDDALLWDAVAAKRPGMPNLLGETGPQPSVAMNGESRWDETKGLGLAERKLALGLAAGNAGSAIWIWSRTDPFRFGRHDGSATLWVEALSGLGAFSRQAAPYLSDARPGEVAMVLPQSLQLSVFNSYAIEAQQKAVRALFHRARASAYAVGEYQLELLGDPKLILLPAPWVLSQQAWDALLEKVRDGATLLITGRFDLDEHFRPTDRHRLAELDYEAGILATRENPVRWPGGSGWATFSGDKTTYLEQAALATGETFRRRSLGAGQILFFTLPLELGDDLELMGSVYRWALAESGVASVYETSLEDPGILICPTVLERATLYVLTSESAARRRVTFRDLASAAELEVALDPGRAALLLVTHAGEVVARYDSDSIGSPRAPAR